ncbi:MAG: nucleotidyl transferase AbiEii/AbiGii toxin family protein [Actinomycetota bacterium]
MASEVNLHQHEEFRDALVAAADHHALDPRFVEKDYYVTEVLRIVADTLPGRTIFKGGTSLSKGWRLVDRFSEDIDLFVDRDRWEPPLGNRPLDRVLKELRDAVAGHPAFTRLPDESKTFSGSGREDQFAYDSLFDELPGLRSAILLEPGVQSGKQPTEDVAISSLVADFLRGRGDADLADDLDPFEMTLLHFRRTFVEKLFTVHSKVERLNQEEEPLGRDARHYADLHVLAGRPEVEAMLRTGEYEEIKADYEQRSLEHFPNSYRPPPGLSFAASEALFPSRDLRDRIEPDYEAECTRLFPGVYPSFDEVLGRLEGLRDLL